MSKEGGEEAGVAAEEAVGGGKKQDQSEWQKERESIVCRAWVWCLGDCVTG